MNDITLTDDQEAAYRAFVGFLNHPSAEAFVLKGYAGTGKTTLVNKMLSDLPKLLKTVALLRPGNKPWDVALTATTNKAAEAMEAITGREVKTIQSYLGLRVVTDYKTKPPTTSLVPVENRRKPTPIRVVLFVDEVSYVDSELLEYIFDLTNDCKIVLIGDPAQLAPVKSNSTPVFHAGFTTAELTEVVRQAEGNQIIDLATAFRNMVTTQEFFQFKPDGEAVIHLPREQFEDAIIDEFTRPDWHHNDSKVLAWTNKTVVGYNHGIRAQVEGNPELMPGDYAICNKHLSNRSITLKTDQTVQVTAIRPDTDLDVEGWRVMINHRAEVFLPKTLAHWQSRRKVAEKDEDFETLFYMDTHWVDLRAVYACTINKSQGSTYDRVFIDLDDVKKCRITHQLGRLLYVGVSRARHQVILTGDLV